MKNFWKKFKIWLRRIFARPIADEDLLFLFEQNDLKLLGKISLSPENEVLLVNFNSFDLFKWYLRHHSLRKPAQFALLDHEEFLRYYVGLKELDHDVECEFIRRNNEDLICYYIEMHDLNYPSEAIMLDICSRNVIIPFIRMHEFGPLALEKLVKSGNEALIRTYIDWHEIRWKSSQLALIENRNEKLIKYYICRYNLIDEAEIAFVNIQNEELLKLYLERHKLSQSAKIAILETGNVKLFEIYSSFNRS